MSIEVDLSQRVAVVTGAGRGIGRSIATTLSRAGAAVVIGDIDGALALSTAAAINEAGGRAVGLACDISQADQADRLIEEAVREFGSIDILVNNAGITRDTLLLRMKPEQWQQVIDVNLNGTFYCTQSAFKHMIKQRRGAIVNISSISGQQGNAGQVNYSASKAGVIGLTKSVAREGAARNIRCNAVAPGFIKTEMTDAIPEKIRQEVVRHIPLGRTGEPEDVANAVLYLVSDLASFVTGHVLDINGGGFFT